MSTDSIDINEQQPPSIFGAELGQVNIHQEGFDTSAKCLNDGRLDININQKTKRFAEYLAPALQLQTDTQHAEAQPIHSQSQLSPPRLNVVIHVVGSRGDVQPFARQSTARKPRSSCSARDTWDLQKLCRR